LGSWVTTEEAIIAAAATLFVRMAATPILIITMIRSWWRHTEPFVFIILVVTVTAMEISKSIGTGSYSGQLYWVIAIVAVAAVQNKGFH
jgi:hypothetical protein